MPTGLVVTVTVSLVVSDIAPMLLYVLSYGFNLYDNSYTCRRGDSSKVICDRDDVHDDDDDDQVINDYECWIDKHDSYDDSEDTIRSSFPANMHSDQTMICETNNVEFESRCLSVCCYIMTHVCRCVVI